MEAFPRPNRRALLAAALAAAVALAVPGRAAAASEKSAEAQSAPATMPATAASAPAATQPAAGTSTSRAVEARLRATKIDLADFDGATLEKAIEMLEPAVGVPVVAKWSILENANIKRSLKLRCPRFKSVPLLTAMAVIFSQPDEMIEFTVHEGAVVISTRDDLSKPAYHQVRTYDVRHLLSADETAEENEGEGPKVPPNDPNLPAMSALEAGAGPRMTMQEVSAAVTAIDPTSWEGGLGSIMQAGTKLVITQTGANHRAIEQMLADLHDPADARLRTKLVATLPHVTLKDASFADAIKQIRQQSGINIVIDPAARTPAKLKVNLDADGLSCEQVLSLVLRMARLQYMLVDGAVYILGPDE